MDTALEIELLNGVKVTMNDLKIGQAMDIAQISPQLNEARISAMIKHVTGERDLAGKLTAQERYFFLISYQTIAEDAYSGGHEGNGARFFIETVQKDVPKTVMVGDMMVGHLYGAHVCALDGVCDNISDWAMGKMACQLSGDLRSILGGDDDEWLWEVLPIDATAAEINQVVQHRVALLNELTTGDFNALSDAFYAGAAQLEHFLLLGCDNAGLTVLPAKSGGAGDNPARFLALDHLQGTVSQLARHITTRRTHNDGTRQNELA